ncbi:MAG: 3-deoxy-manno-octulosonate cytidylyltransferase [Candidatus Eisenbacteria sp.]|nr:3-deoxy-manno-octulosonate cytidylyltransferase [Candidatus Eisenbacteria bacterium]
MNIVAIIPARMGSSRFPGKPMAKIHGIPMIGHVYLRTRMCNLLAGTYVATCDQEIFEYIENIGGHAIMTADTHERCSDRTAEAMLAIEKQTGEEIDIVVMVQGDEPLVTPQAIEESLRLMLEDSSINVVNLMARMKSVEEFEDPNEVKVVVGLDGNALYFSREPIPSRKKGAADVLMLKQVCIIPFRRNYLLRFNSLAETPLERVESVDMMRILENGEQVRMIMTNLETLSVDTPRDLEKVSRLMEADKLLETYQTQCQS